MTIGINPFAPVEALAEQLARPIVRQRTRLLDADDWAHLREYARALSRLGSGSAFDGRAPYVPARVTDEQADHDAAGEWCDE